MDGFLLINKPPGYLSTEIVNHYRKLMKSKVGHAGTLDPFASGLIVILIDNATKLSTLVQKMDKEYIGEIKLGISTDSYDRTGRIIKETKCDDIDDRRIKRSIETLVGEVLQTPPPFSAVKIRGERAYRLARSGIMVKKRPRKVKVNEFRVTGFNHPFLSFQTVVGKGCYIRSLANDLGEKLGCGATLWSLRRMRIGNLRLEDAIGIETKPGIRDIDQLLSYLPRLDVDTDQMDCLVSGSAVEFSTNKEIDLAYITDGKRKIIGYYKNNRLRTKRVIVG